MAVTVRESGRGWSGRVGVMTAWVWSTVSAATGRVCQRSSVDAQSVEEDGQVSPVQVGGHVAGAVHHAGEGDLNEDGVGPFEAPAECALLLGSVDDGVDERRDLVADSLSGPGPGGGC
jgi:hypothetical protein